MIVHVRHVSLTARYVCMCGLPFADVLVIICLASCEASDNAKTALVHSQRSEFVFCYMCGYDSSLLPVAE